VSSSGDFLKVGLGNIDYLPIIVDGDIQAYPTTAYFSKNQTCEFSISDQGTIVTSTLYGPVRVLDPSQNF
jgi:hypothetical protein